MTLCRVLGELPPFPVAMPVPTNPTVTGHLSQERPVDQTDCAAVAADRPARCISVCG